MKRFALFIIMILQVLTVCGKSIDTPSNYEDRIRAHFRAGRWDEGAVIVDSALVKYPGVAAFYELKGQYILHGTEKIEDKTHSYDLARYYLIEAIRIDEKNLNARRLLLRIENETGHYSSAIVYCNELLEESPYNEHLWRTKIDLYRKLGNDLEADRLLERLMTIYPEDTVLRKDVLYRKQELARTQRSNGNIADMEKTLRELIDMDRTDGENYEALVNLLYNNGRLEEAAEVADQGARNTNSAEIRENLISKRAGILTEMNRYTEAINYLTSMKKQHSSARLSRNLNTISIEAARQAKLNDPFEAYAKVYDTQKSNEALNYLINTSIQRNYLDDALYYVQKARQTNDTPELHYKEYLVQKRMGNERRAKVLLKDLYDRDPQKQDIGIELAQYYLDDAAALIDKQQFDEAIPLLQDVCLLNADPEQIQAAYLRLFNCYQQAHMTGKAEELLEEINNRYQLPNYIDHKALLLNAEGNANEALMLLEREYYAYPDSMIQRRKEIADTYEEIVIPFIKSLRESGMTYTADRKIKDALKICPESDDLLRFAISTSMTMKEEGLTRVYIDKGLKIFPNEPFYKLKNAQMIAADKNYRKSIDSLRTLIKTYPADTTIVAAFSDCSENLALQYMKDHKNEMALQVLDSALYYDYNNHSLLYTKHLVYMKMKDWKNAELCLKGYKPNFREMATHMRSLEGIYNHQMKNTLLFEYQQARLGSEDAITANANISYTRKITHQNRKGKIRNDALTFGVAYAGRDGIAHDDVQSKQNEGGTGVLLSAAWEHQFTDRFTATLQAGWSNRYFPELVANLSGTYDMNDDWQLTGRASYRKLKTYTGIYQMKNEFAGYDQFGSAIYNNVMKLTGWDIKSKHMIQVGLGANKTLDEDRHFNLGGGLDGFLLSGNFYGNANLKFMFFPYTDRQSNFYAVSGLGTAPESSLIDQSLAVGFRDLNTYVGMGGNYFINRWMGFGLSGTWYTMLTQNESLSEPLIGTTAMTKSNYSNHFYIHANVIINF